VVPGEINPKLKMAMNRLNVRFVSFEWHERRPVFRGLDEALTSELNLAGETTNAALLIDAVALESTLLTVAGTLTNFVIQSDLPINRFTTAAVLALNAKRAQSHKALLRDSLGKQFDMAER
jgi:hypothetical protein